MKDFLKGICNIVIISLFMPIIIPWIVLGLFVDFICMIGGRSCFAENSIDKLGDFLDRFIK